MGISNAGGRSGGGLEKCLDTRGSTDYSFSGRKGVCLASS